MSMTLNLGLGTRARDQAVIKQTRGHSFTIGVGTGYIITSLTLVVGSRYSLSIII